MIDVKDLSENPDKFRASQRARGADKGALALGFWRHRDRLVKRRGSHDVAAVAMHGDKSQNLAQWVQQLLDQYFDQAYLRESQRIKRETGLAPD